MEIPDLKTIIGHLMDEGDREEGIVELKALVQAEQDFPEWSPDLFNALVSCLGDRSSENLSLILQFLTDETRTLVGSAENLTEY